jgi:MurNAc alpha-1-phosphate uridylyltransferase
MKAMLLAAGRGERMRPLTDNVPKPLLQAGNRTLIEHQLARLQTAGIRDVVINLAYRGQQIRDYLGDGNRYGLHIRYSDEGDDPQETAGAIIRALPLLGAQPFIVINSDIWIDYPLTQLPAKLSGAAHLVMVDNPDHHSKGDFALSGGRLALQGAAKLTYSGLGVYSAELFHGFAAGKRPLREVLHPAIAAGKVSGEHYRGVWLDIGTPERLESLRRLLSGS